MTVVCDLCGGPYYGNVRVNTSVLGEQDSKKVLDHELCEGHFRVFQKLLREAVAKTDNTVIFQRKKP